MIARHLRRYRPILSRSDFFARAFFNNTAFERELDIYWTTEASILSRPFSSTVQDLPLFPRTIPSFSIHRHVSPFITTMSSRNMLSTSALLLAAAAATTSSSASPTTHFDPRDATGGSPQPWNFQVVGNSGVSAQMMFLGTSNKVYILDKTENNPISVTSAVSGTTHPAWATEYDLSTNTYRIMDVLSNSFCAGGGRLGNGTWAIFGGNQPVTTGGVATTSPAAYDDTDGGTAIRLLTPCDDESCEYIQGTQSYNTDGNTGGYLQMTGRRWYPTIEPLADGTLIVIGGDKNGGYVNTAQQDNPTYEFFPKQADDPQGFDWLSENLPVNLYPLTWMMPDGRLFMQANRSTILYDYQNKVRTDLAAMPYAVRVYPGSAATAMLPLTPANNYTATILFCGGSNPPQWGSDGGSGYNVTAVQADNTCVRISPMDANPTYEDDDFMHIGRSMGQFNYLPDGTLWMGNGVSMGTAGYGNENWSVGESYGQAPVYQPALYNPSAPLGSRWNFSLPASTEERMYHSTGITLPDGSIMISGSNPNADYQTRQWGTKYSVERWYPSWYNEVRPGNDALPSTLSYGGSYFNVTLNSTDLTTVQSAKVSVLRTGFSTHAINMGQRYLELETSYQIDENSNTATLFVSQMPPNPALFQPGNAYIHLVVNGVPSIGKEVMIGSGQIGTQPTTTQQALPSATVLAATSATTSASAQATQGSSSSNNSKSGALASSSVAIGAVTLVGLASAFLLLA